MWKSSRVGACENGHHVANVRALEMRMGEMEVGMRIRAGAQPGRPQ